MTRSTSHPVTSSWPRPTSRCPARLPLVLARAHRSSYRAGRWFGRSWASTLDQRLEISDQAICFAAADTVVLRYPHPDTGGEPVLPVTGARWPLARSGSGYTVTDPQPGTTWRFEPRSGYYLSGAGRGRTAAGVGFGPGRAPDHDRLRPRRRSPAGDPRRRLPGAGAHGGRPGHRPGPGRSRSGRPRRRGHAADPVPLRRRGEPGRDHRLVGLAAAAVLRRRRPPDRLGRPQRLVLPVRLRRRRPVRARRGPRRDAERHVRLRPGQPGHHAHRPGRGGDALPRSPTATRSPRSPTRSAPSPAPSTTSSAASPPGPTRWTAPPPGLTTTPGT